jgi:hypothetical protein
LDGHPALDEIAVEVEGGPAHFGDALRGDDERQPATLVGPVAGVFRGDAEIRPGRTRSAGRFVAMVCGNRLFGDSVRRTILVIGATPCLTPAT